MHVFCRDMFVYLCFFVSMYECIHAFEQPPRGPSGKAAVWSAGGGRWLPAIPGPVVSVMERLVLRWLPVTFLVSLCGHEDLCTCLVSVCRH